MKPKDALLQARNAVKVCLLCGAPPVGVGCFIPDEPEKWPLGNAPAGKTKTYWYGLCKACLELPDSGDRVEAKLRAASPDQLAMMGRERRDWN